MERTLPPSLVLTPDWLATAVARHLSPKLPVVDLGAGTGLLTIAAAHRGLRVTAVERDSGLVRFTRGLVRVLQLDTLVNVVEGDVFDYRSPTPAQIVSNPPYTRHHGIPAEAKDVLYNMRSVTGIDLPRTASEYAHFMAWAWTASWSMREVLLVPTNWIETSYGKALRMFLTNERGIEIPSVTEHSRSKPFDDVSTTACIVITDQRRAGAGRVIVGKLDGPLPNPKPMQEHHGTQAKGALRLGDYFDVRRGLATGANSFFLVSEPITDRYGLPQGHLKPVVTSLFEEKAKRLPKQLWVADGELSSGEELFVGVGESQGLHQRYLCAIRKPWWRLVLPPGAPFLVSYMGRGHVRFSMNPEGSVNLNNSHGLYALAGVDEDTANATFRFLGTAEGEKCIRQVARHYQGMWKLEPGDLENVRLPGLADWLSASGPPAASAPIVP